MRCLMCGKKKEEGSLRDILLGDDPLCTACRREWESRKIRFRLKGIPVESSYVYNDAFSRALIQYKELYDEALKDIFLYEVRNTLCLRYHGYTLVLMPSAKEKTAARGFNHLAMMFSSLHMKMADPFEKTTGISQKERTPSMRRQVSHEIVLKKDISLPEKLLLVDDTITTGATLEAALSWIELRKHKVKIYTVSANYRWLLHRRSFIAF